MANRPSQPQLIAVRRFLCGCRICGMPVFGARYQFDSARTCSPHCAKELAHAEHPDLRNVLEDVTYGAN